MEIIETSIFTKRITEILQDDEYKELQNFLCQHPKSGDVIKVGLHYTRLHNALTQDRADKHAYQYLDPTCQSVVWRPYGGERIASANIWKIAEGTRWIDGGIVLLDKRADISKIDFEFVV